MLGVPNGRQDRRLLGPAAERALRAVGVPRRFPARQVLFHEGDPSDFVLLITAGWVKVTCASDGGQEVLLAILGPGAVVGELSALDGGPRSATVSAMEPVEALLLSAREFRAFLLANPQVMLALLQTVVGRLRDADRKRVEHSAHSASRRIARRLLEMVTLQGGQEACPAPVTLRLTQRELGAWADTSREAVTRVLRLLRAQGAVQTARGRITVHDPEPIRRLAR